MTKFKVEIVKYDMDKTKKRKRKNFLVTDKTEAAVITQLEKIHKGEKVVTIHEITWDEEQNEELARVAKLERENIVGGEVRFYEAEKGFGFITPDDEEMDDLYFRRSSLITKDVHDYDRVEFEVSEGPKGLCAIKIKVTEER